MDAAPDAAHGLSAGGAGCCGRVERVQTLARISLCTEQPLAARARGGLTMWLGAKGRARVAAGGSTAATERAAAALRQHEALQRPASALAARPQGRARAPGRWLGGVPDPARQTGAGQRALLQDAQAPRNFIGGQRRRRAAMASHAGRRPSWAPRSGSEASWAGRGHSQCGYVAQ